LFKQLCKGTILIGFWYFFSDKNENIESGNFFRINKYVKNKRKSLLFKGK